MTSPIPSPFFQPNTPPAPKPKPIKRPTINVRVEIRIDWAFVRNVLYKWLTGRPFVQNIEIQQHVLPRQ